MPRPKGKNEPRTWKAVSRWLAKKPYMLRRMGEGCEQGLGAVAAKGFDKNDDQQELVGNANPDRGGVEPVQCGRWNEVEAKIWRIGAEPQQCDHSRQQPCCARNPAHFTEPEPVPPEYDPQRGVQRGG